MADDENGGMVWIERPVPNLGTELRITDQP